MKTQPEQKRFALLVGVDLYLDGSRKVNIPSLRGCVNDTQIIKKLLGNEFSEGVIRILTSSLSPDSAASREPPQSLPTYENIKREFDGITKEAKAGDLFFFHFSGHGARLETVLPGRDRRADDPSLLTMDFGCGKPAIRGWQLNNWLKILNEKGVQIVVSLDSCYSADNWRNEGSLRSPKQWKRPPNLPVDEEGVEATSIEPNDRHGELSVLWDINPEGFVLMAACEGQSVAMEKMFGNSVYGTFTYELCAYVREAPKAAYRTIRDYIAARIQPQVPCFYGQDRFAFLENEELFSATHVWARVSKGVVSLPIGKFHGVEIGAEFVTLPPTPPVTLSIKKVQDSESEATVPSGFLPEAIELVPCRWSLRKAPKISVKEITCEFRKALHDGLKKRIVNEVEFSQTQNLESVSLRLTKAANGKIGISGPQSLIGYEGHVRGLETKGENDKEQATELAVALSHLMRFEQILELRNDATRDDNPPFKATLNDLEQVDGAPRFEYRFQNCDEVPLHFTVMVLGPGFHIKQLYPENDGSYTVAQDRTSSFTFKLVLPTELKQVGKSHRDIFRTIVTRKKKLSFKSWELPDIWNANQTLYKRREDLARDAELITDDGNGLWMQDITKSSTLN
ncbi:caspase domain-containing protein [Annulohypoxylon truncatum]|uniref:caspase domain-containing protein n=1 Tax=Annulohypoxylon truncatum TaxID=327061 RepID=UPI002008AD98|nr:caspase domain-containing protein [Annulohypoxylon truncatum]KAI1204904.1 caspase domain-containing protein [Annulohypoxylon truncatum]